MLEGSTADVSELLADPLSNELAPEYQQYAALLVSKVYFYIGELEEAVEFALKAGEAFERELPGEYRETIIGECYSGYADVQPAASIRQSASHRRGNRWMKLWLRWWRWYSSRMLARMAS